MIFLQIRPFEPGDRAVFFTMAREFYRSPAVLHPSPDDCFARTFDALMAGTPYADGFLIESDGDAAGYLLTARTWSNEIGGEVVWAEELYIRPAFQHRGLGRAALAFLHDYYPQARRFRLEVTPENRDAVRLYERLGYREMGYRQMVRE